MIARIVVTGLVIAALGLSACGRKGPLQAPPAPQDQQQQQQHQQPQQQNPPQPQPKP
ncbi:MAG: lipoprotein [Alphaproteobacteria bacterium]|nr:lipoprotein [Alphaproteobacteria bacterium]